MTALRIRVSAAMLAGVAVLASVAPALSSAFVAWRVTGVAPGDLLNVRAYPSPNSRILVGFPNGTLLSMTGRCTGGVDLTAIQGLPSPTQRQTIRYQWCQAWLDPQGNGSFQPGWVYGRYLRPA